MKQGQFDEFIQVWSKPDYIDQVLAAFGEQIATFEILKAHDASIYHKLARSNIA